MIFLEDEVIKLNGVILPGVVKSIEVKESAQIDEQEVEGSAVKPKQAVGYEDAKINIELILDDTESATKYERLATLRALFRTSGQSVPQPISIVCENTAVHGIDKVLFKSLTHKLENKKGQLPVTIELWEYVPQTIQTTRSSGSSTSTKPSSSTSNISNTSSSFTLSASYQRYLSTNRGSSPATDSAKPPKPTGQMKPIQLK